MIALLAATAMQSSHMLEWFDNKAPVISIQAIVKLPPLTNKQSSILRMVSSCLGQDTKSYSGAQIRDTLAHSGSRLRVSLMPDHLRLGMEVTTGDVVTGLSLMGAVLKESVLSTEALQKSGNDLITRRMPYWRQALEAQTFEVPRYSQQELQDVMTLVFRPENVYMTVGGNLVPGVATKKWDSVVQSWTVARLPRPEKETGKPPTPPTLDGRVSVIEFSCPTFSAADAAFNIKLLAITALGTGKGAALWRVPREKMMLSYRQEAVLYPVQEGFRPRLLIASEGKEELEKKAMAVREALLEDIKSWTETDKKRAIGMAESYLTRGGDLSPLYFTTGRPVSRDISDQTFLQGYWRMKTSTPWVPFQIVGRLGFIELADLKQTAEEMVAKSELKVYPAGQSNSGS